jgi:hypothetical protein
MSKHVTRKWKYISKSKVPNGQNKILEFGNTWKSIIEHMPKGKALLIPKSMNTSTFYALKRNGMEIEIIRNNGDLYIIKK